MLAHAHTCVVGEARRRHNGRLGWQEGTESSTRRALRPRAAVSLIFSVVADAVCPGPFRVDYSPCRYAEASYHIHYHTLRRRVRAGHRRMFNGLRVISGFR